MTWIRTIVPEEATGRLRAIYDAAIQRAGRVFGITRAMSLSPAITEKSMDLYVAMMFAREGLTRRQREMIAVVVSRTNGCHY